MQLKVQMRDGRSSCQGVRDLLARVLTLLNSSGDNISESLQDTTRDHFQARFPGSSHYAPSKVNAVPSKTSSTGAEGQADIDVAGASRAYHDITITPVKRQALTIPMHQSAYGKSPREVQGLFVLKTKSGSAFLAKHEGKQLVLMWQLAKKAFQKQDESIMPNDNSLASRIFDSVSESIMQDNLAKDIK